MKKLFSRRVTREALVRMVADVLLVNFALFSSMALRLFYLILFEPSVGVWDHKTALLAYVNTYERGAWALTLICLIVFLVSGFYTRGRMYQSRYKIIVILQAVTASYLVFGFFSYFFVGALGIPRAALVLSWLVTTVLLILVRFWSMFWKGVATTERRQQGMKQDRQIRRVLVIGGAGYIGSALVPKLLAHGYRIRLLDMLLYGPDPLRGVANHPRLEIIKADFRQVDKVVDAMQDVDAVIHLGGIVGDPACALDEKLTVEINLMATRMIAEVAKGTGVNRFIFASTCSVYGASDQILDEHSALKPVSLYARSKIASEKVLLQMADERFAPVILRFGTIYGLSGRTRFDLVVNVLTAAAVVERKMTIIGGDQWRPFLHVDDAALALLRCLRVDLRLVRGEVINVGSNEQNYTIRRVGEVIRELVPPAELIELSHNGDRRNYRVDFSKIENLVGFTPAWSLEAGVRQVIDALESGAVKDYRDPRHSNVKFLGEENGYRLSPNGTEWAYDLLNDTLPGMEAA
jgi:nucleoside-diphosphate-sugar epimerase